MKLNIGKKYNVISEFTLDLNILPMSFTEAAFFPRCVSNFVCNKTIPKNFMINNYI